MSQGFLPSLPVSLLPIRSPGVLLCALPKLNGGISGKEKVDQEGELRALCTRTALSIKFCRLGNRLPLQAAGRGTRVRAHSPLQPSAGFQPLGAEGLTRGKE